MKKFLLIFFSSIAILRADELTKSVQSQLKELGFFYAEVNGTSGPETTAAIRRFQIRNGYEVTGTLTKETLKALGLASENAPAKAVPAAPKAPVASEKKDEPIHPRRDETVQESDRNFLRQESAKQRVTRDPAVVSPPAPLPVPPEPGVTPLSHIFANTPLESAPAFEQTQTLRKAQALLAREGLFHEPIDGGPGPALEESLLRYQRRRNLVMTGRLDAETLRAMALLAPAKDDPAARPFTVPRGDRYPPRVLRGIWID